MDSLPAPKTGPEQPDVMDVRRQAETYRLDTIYLGTGHYKAAERIQRYQRWIGVPAAVLSAVVGTAIFASVSLEPSVGWRIAVGLVSLGAAVLTTLQALFGFDARAQQHRAAGAAYASLRREFDGFLLQLNSAPTRETALDGLAQLRRRLDVAAEGRPLIPDKAYDAAVKAIDAEADRDPTSIGVTRASRSG